MNKYAISLCVICGFSAPVLAQSNVTIGGRVNMGYRQVTNDRIGAKLEQESGNRIFFAGQEDLGGGNSAFFRWEERFSLDTGVPAAAMAESYLGIKGEFGSAFFGRTYSLVDTTIDAGKYEAFVGNTIAGSNRYGLRANTRWNNTAFYTSPRLGPLSVFSAFSLSESNSVKNAYGAGLRFQAGDLNAALAYQRDVSTDNSSTLGNNPWKTVVASANYNFGAIQVFGTVGKSKGYNSEAPGGYNLQGAKEVFYSTGLVAPVGPGSLRAQAARYQDTSTTGEKQPGQTHFGIAYWYNWTKRTTLQFATVFKKQRGGYKGSTFSNSTNSFSSLGSSNNQTGFEVALRHDF